MAAECLDAGLSAAVALRGAENLPEAPALAGGNTGLLAVAATLCSLR